MSDDLIKRSDAIKAIDELPNAYNGWSDAYDKAYIIGTLEEVPSADRPSAVDLSSVYSTAYKSGYEKGKADRPQGEWMHDTSSPIAYRCSACNTLQHWSVIQNGRYHFCPNCGARMKGTDDE